MERKDEKIEYEGVEICDFTDLYNLIDFKNQTPKLSPQMMDKFRAQLEGATITKSKTNIVLLYLIIACSPPSTRIKRRKNFEDGVDKDFYSELQKHQVVKNRWDSSLGDKLVLIEKMDSYQRQLV